jgi:hypothetical protein
MPLYKRLHNLLIAFVQIASKMGLQKKGFSFLIGGSDATLL